MASTYPRSRYPRPLKATHSFTGPTNGGHVISNGGHVTGHSLCSSLPTSPSGSAISCGCKTTNSQENRVQQSPKEPNPRRSSSMGSLADPDNYWATPIVQSEGEEVCDSEVMGFTHKRSNSLSSADHMTRPSGKGEPSPAAIVHTCKSIEGLNQEISKVLEGQPSMMNHHPDGHIAPVRDLLLHLSMGGTPPHTHTFPSSQTPSPYPAHTASPASHPHHLEQPDMITGNQTHSHIVSRESPGTPDYPHHHPASPKPSFAREPPDSAERCIIKHRLYSADFIQKGPDRSKANIIFKGTAFAPFLTTPPLPVSGQC